MIKKYLLKGLDCPHCSAGIEKDIGNAEGVNSSVYNLVNQTLTLDIDLSIEDTIGYIISKTIKSYGHRADITELSENTSKVFVLKGLDCPNCAAKIELELNTLDCISDAQINLMNQTLSVEYSKVSPEFLLEMISDIVHDHEPQVEVLEQTAAVSAKKEKTEDSILPTLIRFGAGALLYAAGLILPRVLPLPSYAGLAILIAAYLILGFDVLLKAFKNILRGRIFDENFLMTISTAGAFAIGEYPEAVAVMLFYQVGEFFQGLAVRRSRRSISDLMDIRPDSACVVRNGIEETVSPETVSVGEIIVVKPGEKIPLDGIITEGESSLDTKALTGESLPRDVRPGDEALSGCINRSGVISIRVTKSFGDSTAAKIIDLVENASARKAPTENFITSFARYYTPAVVIFAALLAILPPLFFGGQWADWIHRGCVFLVISCPCALVISIPLAFFGGIGAASRHGVLIKGSNYLEALNKVSTVVFDKTGTLTKGVFTVTEIIPADGFSEEQTLRYAAMAESFSNHPIAKSILASFGDDADKSQLKDYQEISGYGISVLYNGRPILAGSGKLMEKNGIAYTPCESAGTKVYVSYDNVYAGCILIADEIKQDSEKAISDLKAMGIGKTIMLTGDSDSIGKSVASRLKLDEYYAELLPQEKVEKLEKLDNAKPSGSKLAFVGDGINDAPVLARADVGIAMGGLGSDAAIEAADVVLMTDEPSRIVEAINIARSTKRIVIQNIIIALGIKGIFLVLGAMGIAGMWEAVFGDVGVALIAVLNSMRILRK